jgi:hypothetical protein
MDAPADPTKPVSLLLEEALAAETPTVGELVDRTAEGGFAVVLALLTLPMLLPLPPGLPAAIGIMLTLAGAQMAAGRRTPLLPERVRRIVVPQSARRVLAGRALVVLRRLESITRVRPPATDGPMARIAGGSTVLAMGLVMALPIPFLNTPPAMAVLLVALGLSGRDGRFLVFGAVAGLLIATGLAAVFAAMWWWGKSWFGI